MNAHPFHCNSWYLVVKIGVVLLSFWLALFLAWHTLSSVHFLYPLLYDTLDFGAVIQHYAPLNIHKSDFEQTDRTQHIALFAEIVRAINRGGEGLAEMVYYTPQGQVIDTFLHSAEVIHLQDVANLLETLTRATYWVMGGLCLLVMGLKWKKRPLNHLAKTLGWTLAALGGGTFLVIAWDAQALFYALHTLVFPEQHQWFFYYQESLMTTLMKAPDIFAAIAGLLLVVAFGYCAIILWLISRVLRVQKS